MKLVFEAETFQQLRDQVLQTALQFTRMGQASPGVESLDKKRAEKKKVEPLGDAKSPK